MFYSLFAKQATIHPDKIAVVCDGSHITYGDMSLSIETVAKNLNSIGIKSGDLCCVCFDNSINYLILYYAMVRLGIRIMPLTTTMAPHEIEMFCRECEPSYFIVHPPYHDKFSTIASSLGAGMLISERTEPHNLASIFQRQVRSTVSLPDMIWKDQDLVIHYNTPNSPEAGERFKGAVQTHESHAHRMLNWAKAANITHEDRTLCMHPIMHAFGSEMFAFPALSTGQTLYLMTASEVTPANVAKAIADNHITLFGALPWFYQELANLPHESRADLSSLRVAMCAATPLPIEVAERFFELYGKRVSNSYGLTETSLIASNLDNGSMDDMLTVGRAIPNVDVCIRDCGIGMPDVGELLVRSNGFSVRYYSADVPPLWRDGWIHTGDLVRQEMDSGFYVLGRVTQVITTADGKFLPLEVEEAIGRHPHVKEVAVVPVESETGVQAAAFIVPNGTVTEDDIRHYVEQTLSKYKVPAHIRFRDSLPKSATGKISRAKLRIEGHS
ncbi:class I adenylate-forming enzyme family protein [Chitinivorax sp. B]|uniref:class I adenylate-forming enzyme family protein n=1 Tax=Chitinivorax sp. B TaxID=2502235 RepID=UPI0010F6ADB5|nr:class I adenylate-forming enzyme family protein [Chitinivorax sp. B]